MTKWGIWELNTGDQVIITSDVYVFGMYQDEFVDIMSLESIWTPDSIEVLWLRSSGCAHLSDIFEGMPDDV